MFFGMISKYYSYEITSPIDEMMKLDDQDDVTTFCRHAHACLASGALGANIH